VECFESDFRRNVLIHGENALEREWVRLPRGGREI